MGGRLKSSEVGGLLGGRKAKYPLGGFDQERQSLGLSCSPTFPSMNECTDKTSFQGQLRNESSFSAHEACHLKEMI